MTTQGDPAEHVYLLIKRCAQYFFLTQAGRKLLLRWFLPGEIFGGCAFLPSPAPCVVSTGALKSSTTLLWDRSTVRKMAERFPRLWENALAIASEYLTLYVSMHVALTSQNAYGRLSEILLNLAATIGRPAGSGFELEISGEELANAANALGHSPRRAGKYCSILLNDCPRKSSRLLYASVRDCSSAMMFFCSDVYAL